MHYLTFVGRVARLTGTSEDRAATLTAATLETFAQRLTGGEVLDLAAQLPKPLQGLLSPYPAGRGGRAVRRAEFVTRVALPGRLRREHRPRRRTRGVHQLRERSAAASSRTSWSSSRATTATWWNRRSPRPPRAGA
ncbi:LOW QUALITY PROTEIN: hypothetical protein MCBG_01158, partial [Micromonospora sp. M42]